MSHRAKRSSNKETYSSWYSWLPSAIGMGFLTLIAHLFLKQWVSLKILGPAEFTVMVFWVIVSGFKKERRDVHFWKIIALFFCFHLVAMILLVWDGVYLSIFEKSQRTVITSAGIAESIIIAGATAYIIRGKDLLDEFD